MNQKHQLEALAEQFSNWRSSKDKSRNTPEHLVKSAVDAIDHHSKTEILKALRINNNTLKRWESQFKEPETQFVELPTSGSICETDKKLQVKLNFADLTLSVSGECCELANFVRQLTEGGQS